MTIIDGPEITTKPSKSSVTLGEKNRVDFTCKADGNPAPNITWSRDQTILGNGENLKLTAEQSQSGVYTCTASNGVGTKKSATVTVTIENGTLSP